MKKTKALAGLAGVAVIAALAATFNGHATGLASAAATKTCNASVGLAAPLTGPVASIGQEQLHWAQLSLDTYNKANKTSYKMIQGDSPVVNVAASIAVARQFASNKKIAVVVGPAGSQEVQAFGPSMKGMAYLSMSATRDDLTNGKRPSFFRVVGSDDAQGLIDATYALDKLKADNIFVISDGSSYSVGLAARFVNVAHKAGATVTLDAITQQQTDFSALVDKIGSSVDLVFLPWQVASQAQTFAQQMKAKGKSAIIFGSDGVFSPNDFNQEGAYVSSFARDIHGLPGAAALIKAYETKYGKFGTFGPPTFVAMQVALSALDKACQAGAATRSTVLAQVKKTNIAKTILGRPIRFDANGDVVGASFYIYRISGGKYKLVFPT